MYRISKPCLVIATVFVGVTIVFAANWFAVHDSRRSSVDSDGLYIGAQTDYDMAMRFALRRISKDISRYPKAHRFVVRWSMSPFAWLYLDDEYDRKNIEYDRDARTLLRTDEGGATGWNNVTVPMLEKAAKTDHPSKAFTEYGCPDYP